MRVRVRQSVGRTVLVRVCCQLHHHNHHRHSTTTTTNNNRVIKPSRLTARQQELLREFAKEEGS
jgi:hypothetical protein